MINLEKIAQNAFLNELEKLSMSNPLIKGKARQLLADRMRFLKNSGRSDLASIVRDNTNEVIKKPVNKFNPLKSISKLFV